MKAILIRIAIILFFSSISSSILHAQKYSSYLKYEIYNNNFLMLNEYEDSRLNYTTKDYVRKLNKVRKIRKKERRNRKKIKICDPRSVSIPYPDRRTSSNKIQCNFYSGKKFHPAPTNRQFKTKWNPETHKFDKGFLFGEKSRHRDIKLNLKLRGKKSLLWRKGFRCDWNITDTNGESKNYNGRDCKFFKLRRKTEVEYKVRVIVKQKGKIVHTNNNLSFKIKDFLIVAVGDSFGSGEGNPHTYYPDTFTADSSKKPPMWLDPRCHRSLYSSTIQSARILALDYKNYSFSVANFACSGAESDTGLLFHYTGRSTASQVAQLWRLDEIDRFPKSKYDSFLGYNYESNNPFLHQLALENPKTKPAPFDIPPQIDQLASALDCDKYGKCKRHPDALFIYIGVNDIGFGARLVEVITGCLERKKVNDNGNTCKEEAINSITKGLESTKLNLEKFSKELTNRGIITDEYDTTIYIVTYPSPVTKSLVGKSGKIIKNEYRVCGVGKLTFGKVKQEVPFLGGLPSLLGFRFNEFRSIFARDEIVKPLNKMLRGFRDSARKKQRELNSESRIIWDLIENKQSLLGRGFCAEIRDFNNFEDSKFKQGTVQRDHIWEDFKCTKVNNKACKVSHAYPVPSGAMHPNYFGHREVAAKIITKLESQFQLESPKKIPLREILED